MTQEVLSWIAIGGLAVVGLAAIGTRIFHEFSISELEEYCRRRKRDDLFAWILDRHENVAHGAESLLTLSITVFLAAGGMWMAQAAGVQDGPSWATLLAIVAGGTILLHVTTSWIPWAIVRIWSAPFLFHTWRFWTTVAVVLWPLNVGVSVFDVLLRRLAGRSQEEEDEEEAFEDEIRSMVTAGQREGLLEADAREMIEGVIELGDTDVADIMTPRSDVEALEIDLTWSQMLQFVSDAGRTRFPVYEKSLDKIVGVLFAKDLLSEFTKDEHDRRSLREIVREPWFVPTTKPVDDILQDFRQTHSHLAIVVDEYQSVAGVVTIEDVLEEIVGEIEDEADKDIQDAIQRINDSTAEALGRVHLDELNEQLGLALPESDDFDTVAGLVIDHFGYIPKAGESVTQHNVRFVVLEATPRKIERLRIEFLEKANGKLTDGVA